jgi:hypothetical protein
VTAPLPYSPEELELLRTGANYRTRQNARWFATLAAERDALRAERDAIATSLAGAAGCSVEDAKAHHDEIAIGLSEVCDSLNEELAAALAALGSLRNDECGCTFSSVDGSGGETCRRCATADAVLAKYPEPHGG